MEEEKKTSELEETETVPIDEKKETIHFPALGAVIIGVLMVAIVVFFILAMVFKDR